MIRRPPRSTRTDTLFPYTTLFRSTLNSFDHQRDALAHTNAHGAQRIAALDPVQLVDGGVDQHPAARAQRMTQSIRAPVGIDAWIRIIQSDPPQHREALRGDRCVEFDQIGKAQCWERVGQYEE